MEEQKKQNSRLVKERFGKKKKKFPEPTNIQKKGWKLLDP